MFSTEPSRARNLWRPLSGDRSRQIVTIAAAAAQILLPTLYGPRFTEDERPPDVISPAPYTFAVWLPIFAASAGYAAAQGRSPRTDLTRSVGWPLAAAFASTGIWAPLVRTGRYWSAQTALVGIAAFAEVARQRLVRQPQAGNDPMVVTTATATTGMLAAWGLAATGVNLGAMLVGEGPVRTQRARTVLGTGLLLGLGAAGTAATASTMRSAPRVSRVYAGTLLWGLTGVVVGHRKKSRPAAAAAAVAAALPVLAAAIGRRRSRH